MKSRTHWTYSEAREAASKQFPVEINRYELARIISADDSDGAYLGELLVNFLNGKKTWNRDATAYQKPTRAEVQKQLLEKHEQIFEADTLRRWCSANQIAERQVDGPVYFEKYGKEI
jgi:hypothetical protein